MTPQSSSLEKFSLPANVYFEIGALRLRPQPTPLLGDIHADIGHLSDGQRQR